MQGLRTKQSSAVPPAAQCNARWQSEYWAATLALEATLNLPWCSDVEVDIANAQARSMLICCRTRLW